jgi:hypothetical protein
MCPETDEIGLPDLSEEDVEKLAEECEAKITEFILKKIPKKSVSELYVICSLQLGDQLNLDVQLDVSQDFDGGVPLEELLDEATKHGVKWLESQLQELKRNES